MAARVDGRVETAAARLASLSHFSPNSGFENAADALAQLLSEGHFRALQLLAVVTKLNLVLKISRAEL